MAMEELLSLDYGLNRVDKIDEHVDSMAWLMKDETMPPVLKITDQF